MANNCDLPTVDISPFFVDKDESGRKKVMQEIYEACIEYGFFVLTNHGMSSELMARSLQVSKSFFACEDEEKLECRPKPEALPPVGYIKSPNQSVERNEHFMYIPTSKFNQYPKNPPELRQVWDDMYSCLSKLSCLMEVVINDCLGLPPKFLSTYNDTKTGNNMIYLHYFPAPENENENENENEKIGKSSHEDGNNFTFLFQESVGGLQVLKDGEWMTIVTPKGAVVVTIGDTIKVLSNDKFKSATHRVVGLPGKDRYSCAFFHNLHGDKWVEPLHQFTKEIGVSPKYRGFYYKDYLKLRVRNITHLQEDRVGISHYSI